MLSIDQVFPKKGLVSSTIYHKNTNQSLNERTWICSISILSSSILMLFKEFLVKSQMSLAFHDAFFPKVITCSSIVY